MRLFLDLTFAAVLAVGVVAAAAVRTSQDFSIDLGPGDAAWQRLVVGATPEGMVRRAATISLPGLRRKTPGQVLLRLGDHAVARLRIDEQSVQSVRTNRDGELVALLPPAPFPGARITLSPSPGALPLHVRRITVTAPSPPLVVSLLAFGLAAALAWTIARRRGWLLALASGLAASALLALAASSALFWVVGSLPRVLVPLILFSASVVLVYAKRVDRRFYWTATGLLAAVLLGGWVRFYFLPSAGSWDTEYWKAWMTRSVRLGVTRVYGDPDATPPGHFLAQLWGREELFRVPYQGRELAVDYPPLAMALWSGSLRAVRMLAPGPVPGDWPRYRD